MRDRGRMVLSMVVACALAGVLAPAAGATRRHATQQRLRPRLEVRPGQPHRHHRPDRRVRRRRRPGLRRLGRGARSTSRTTGASSSTRPPTAPPAAPASSRAASAGTARPSPCRRSAPASASRSSSTASTWTPSSTSTASRSAATRTATPASRSTSPTAHTDGTRRTCIAVKVRNKLPSSRWYSGSGIYRNVHLRRHRPGARGAPRHVRDHARRREHVQARLRHASTCARTSRGDRRHARRHPRPRRPRPHRARRRPATPADGSRQTSDLRLSRPAPVVDRRPLPLHAGHRGPRRRQDRRPHHDELRRPLVPLRPGRRASRSTARTIKIKGVDLHHDQGALGAAVNKDALMRQMTIMKRMGVNAFRTSHNPPSPEMIEVCQELGHRDDGRGLRLLAHPQARSSTTGASSTPTATATSRRWSTPPRTRRPSCCGRSATRSRTRRRSPGARRSPSG